jgi:hypothetical protein
MLCVQPLELRFEVLVAVSIQRVVCRDVAPCNLLYSQGYRRNVPPPVHPADRGDSPLKYWYLLYRLHVVTSRNAGHDLSSFAGLGT